MTAPLTTTPVFIGSINHRAVNQMLVDALNRISAQIRFNLSAADNTDAENYEQTVQLTVNDKRYDFQLHRFVMSEKGYGSVILESSEDELNPNPASHFRTAIRLFVALTGSQGATPDDYASEYGGLTWFAAPQAFIIDKPYQSDPGDLLLDRFYSQSNGELLTLFGL